MSRLRKPLRNRPSGPRLYFLTALAAAFLLVPAVSASAAEVHIIIEGTGAGTVKGVPPLDGTLPINCTYASPGPKTGACDAAMNTSEGLEGEKVLEEAAPGSEFAGWTSEGGLPLGCEPQPSLAPECGVLSFGGPVTIKATFVVAPGTPHTLTVAPIGEGEVNANEPPTPLSGKISGCEETPVECSAEYNDGDEVTLVATPESGWKVEAGSWTNCAELSATECKATVDADKTVEVEFVKEALPPHTLTVAPTGEGEVNANEPPTPLSGKISGCEETPVECSAEYNDGDEVTLVATPESGWKVEAGSWTNCAELSATECKATVDADKTVEVEFVKEAPPPHTLTVAPTGEGEVNANEPPTPLSGKISGCEETPVECSAEYNDGDEVTLVATPESGWKVEAGSWTNCAELSATECKATVDADKTVEVTFTAILKPSTLTVFKGGNGEGTVTSNPAGISCGTEPCEAIFEEGDTIELEASPESGSVFAGWLGCHPVSGEADKCHVTLNGSEIDVTAVFLAEGPEGPQGEPGQGVTATPEPAGANCTYGGVKVVSESGTQYVCNGAPGAAGTPGQGVTVTSEPAGANCTYGGVKVVSESGTKYVCNGAPGAAGTPGQGVTVTPEPAGANCTYGGIKVVSESGTKFVCNGPPGSNGSNGTNGTNGKDGTNGAAGSQGPAGLQGAQGPQGPAGKVTCTVKKKGAKVKVTCVVKTAASSSLRRLGWRLMRGGRTYSHGKTTVDRLQTVLNHLRKGRYVLRVSGQKGGTRIAIH